MCDVTCDSVVLSMTVRIITLLLTLLPSHLPQVGLVALGILTDVRMGRVKENERMRARQASRHVILNTNGNTTNT